MISALYFFPTLYAPLLMLQFWIFVSTGMGHGLRLRHEDLVHDWLPSYRELNSRFFDCCHVIIYRLSFFFYMLHLDVAFCTFRNIKQICITKMNGIDWMCASCIIKLIFIIVVIILKIYIFFFASKNCYIFFLEVMLFTTLSTKQNSEFPPVLNIDFFLSCYS